MNIDHVIVNINAIIDANMPIFSNLIDQTLIGDNGYDDILLSNQREVYLAKMKGLNHQILQTMKTSSATDYIGAALLIC
tara:strand:+ start:12148 stop:12384 length:237 start_codon:yes stop_codon:yes gene_type:complete